jgi:Amt family ammonium transporter
VGLFADGSYGVGWNLTDTLKTAERGVTGLFYDFSLGASQLAAQAIGALVICTVMFGIVLAFFKIQNKLTKGGIRPTDDVEHQGLDLPEMGVLAYPQFIGDQVTSTSADGYRVTVGVGAPVDE